MRILSHTEFFVPPPLSLFFFFYWDDFWAQPLNDLEEISFSGDAFMLYNTYAMLHASVI